MRAVLLSGGVGGARLGRGLIDVVDELTMVVNVGDDDEAYGLYVSPDIDTVIYTLSGIEGPNGWGIEGDSLQAMARLESLGAGTSFQIGDRDLGTNLYRTIRLREGASLSEVTEELVEAAGLRCRVLPVTDSPVATRIRTAAGDWLSFQDYFVARGHQDEVVELEFRGVETAAPTEAVQRVLSEADAMIIGPSNPALSIWPMLAIPGVARCLQRARVLGVSPLIGGRAVKGPADRVLRSLGFPRGNAGVVAAYDGLLTDLVVDQEDGADRAALASPSMTVHVLDTRIEEPEAAIQFARALIDLL